LLLEGVDAGEKGGGGKQAGIVREVYFAPTGVRTGIKPKANRTGGAMCCPFKF